MRYYDITIGDLHYQSLGGNGRANPGALNVELDISLNYADVAANGSWVRVWGIPLSDISQARNLYGKPVKVLGGMSAGLPLANPAEAGPLGAGGVWRAFGNWVGTDLTLDVILSSSGVLPSKGSPNPEPTPRNIVLNWPKGADLTGPLQKALQQGFPGFNIIMNIASNYKPPTDQVHFNGGVEQFGQYLRRYTQMLAGKGSVGVGLCVIGTDIHVNDHSQPQAAGTINYQDLIGQPTWVDLDRLSIKLVMRGDIIPGQTVILPQTPVINTAGGGHNTGGESPQQSLTFSGKCLVNNVRHVGNFRQADAASWVTILDANTAGSGS